MPIVTTYIKISINVGKYKNEQHYNLSVELAVVYLRI